MILWSDLSHHSSLLVMMSLVTKSSLQLCLLHMNWVCLNHHIHHKQDLSKQIMKMINIYMNLTLAPSVLEYCVHPCPLLPVIRSSRSSTQPLALYLDTVEILSGYPPPVNRNVSPSSIKQEHLKKMHFTSLMGNNLNLPTIFWTCSCQSTPTLVFELKIKQLRVQNWQKTSNCNLYD